MFINETVFILGAGASCHYGYPTGAELVDLVGKKAIELRDLLSELKSHASFNLPALIKPPGYQVDHFDAAKIMAPWRVGIQQCQTIIQRLEEARPLVIDYFLGHNADIEDLGRFLIAWIILECEQKQTDKGKWHRFIVAQLLNGCSQSSDLLNNRVRFITFNYDTSLDRALRNGLRAHSAFAQTHVDRFLEDRIVHLYGKIQEPYAPEPNLDFHVFDTPARDRPHDVIEVLDQIYQASKGIRVIDPKDKDKDNEHAFEAASTLIGKAKVVYILGYGFDENNSERLHLAENLRTDEKSVLFTNFRDANRINKKASRLLFGNTRHFLPPDTPIIRGNGNRYYEKSIKDVYKALSLDFDSLEEQAL